MKPITLNATAAAIFAILIEGLDDTNSSKKLNNAPGAYMPVSVEFLGEVQGDGRTFKRYSVTHYGEQNGDLMSDPDVTFMVSGNAIYPATYRNDYVGVDNEYCFINDKGQVVIKEAKMAELAKFCAMWFTNIKHQQGLKAAKVA